MLEAGNCTRSVPAVSCPHERYVMIMLLIVLFTDLNLYCIKGALALVVLVSFSGYVC